MTRLPARETGADKGHEPRLHEVIAAYLEAREGGIEPDRQAILDREPDLAAELTSFFANQDRLANVAKQRPAQLEGDWQGILRYPGVETEAGISARACDDDRAGASVHPAIPSRVRYFGDYELLDEIAQGGMGVVYRARQVSLNRIVALKMIRAGRLASSEDLVRFRLEAEAVAHLDHPGIVPIYEVGVHEGHDYFSMKLIEGGNLAGRADGFRASPRAAARLVSLVARAVHYVHQRGILHRDLKPANILLTESPEETVDRLTPVVTDFGLAKRVVADAGGPTSSGNIVGTPCYMSPEQAEGRREAVTTAVDIHALGAILYELLVGRPPYRGETVLETLRQVRELEPVRPRLRERRVPRDLETIVLKCLEKRQSDRYASAEALADDLDRWSAGLPILARPATPAERLLKWARRRPAIAGLIALGLLSSLATILAIRGHLSATRLESDVARVGRARDDESRKRQEAESELASRESQLYRKSLVAAQQAWEQDEPERADSLLDRCPVDLRRWEWHHLRHRFHSELRTLKGHNGFLCATAFTPEGGQLACASEEAGFLLWEPSGERGGRRIPGHDGTSYGIAFDRAGTRMACALATGTVRLINLGAHTTVGRLGRHEGWVAGVAFSPDGRTLASSGQDGTVCLWDVRGTSFPEGTLPARVLRGHSGPVFGVAFGPDGEKLASAGHDGTVRLWDLKDGKSSEAMVFRGHAQPVRCVAFHPLGTLVASAGADRVVRVWEVETGHEVLQFGDFGHRVDGVAFSPDGLKIATASQDRSVRIWDSLSGLPIARYHGHGAPVFSVTFSPDGTKLASVGQDATVKLWDLTTDPGVRRLMLGPQAGDRDHRALSWSGGVAFRPDGRELAVGGSRETLAVWTLASGAGRTAADLFRDGGVIAVQYSPDGRELATVSTDRRVRIRESATLQERLFLQDGPQGFSSLAFSPDGKLVATGGGDAPEVLQQPFGKFTPAADSPRDIRLWARTDGKSLRRLSDHRGSIHALVFHPGGTHLISAGSDRTIRVWELGSGAIVHRLEGHDDTVYALALSRDGRLLASAGADRTVRIWRLEDGRLLHVLEGHVNWVQALAFHPDGTRLASAGGDRSIRLWDPVAGRDVLTLQGHRDRVHGLAFSPDGWTLASSSSDGEIRLWESRSRDDGSPRN